MRLSERNSEEVADVIREMKGNIAAVATKFGCQRNTVYSYIETHPELREVLEDARETMLDHAESALYRAVLNGEGWAVCFLLKTQGKKRGYLERVDFTSMGRQIGAIEVRYVSNNGHERTEARAASLN